MNQEYKKFIVNHAYGMIDHNNCSQSYLNESFQQRFGHEAKITNTITKNDNGWIIKTMTIDIDGETFALTRDLEAEYLKDIKHPNYHSVLFYELGESIISVNHSSLIQQIDNNQI